MRIIICLLILFFLQFFIRPSLVSASVLINEILPHPSSGADWIELYNTESTELDISGWKIQDSTGDLTPFPDGTKFSSPSAFYQIFASNRLNNGGDSIKLKDKDGNIIDEKSYNQDPGEDISFGRYPDGSNNWGILTSSTANNSNSSLVPSPTVTPTNVPTAVPTSVPTSTPMNTSAPTATSKPQSTPTKYISPTIKLVITTSNPVDKSNTAVLGEASDSAKEQVEEKIAGVNEKKPFPIFLFFLGSGLIFIIAAIVVSVRQIKKNKMTN